MANRLRVGSGETDGFTIVELIIVIVIISILASITLVAYAGVQDRARNTSVVDAASSILKMIQVYATTNAAYPGTVATGTCVTTSSGCNSWGTAIPSDSAFDTNMGTVGNVPRSVPTVIADSFKGIYYYYQTGHSMNGKVQPAFIVYHLKGTSQQCGVPGVNSSTAMVATSSTTGYTDNGTWNGTPVTVCYVTVPGPTS